MNGLLRAGLLAALASICVDGQAKVAEHCITMLEARPAGVETPPPAPRKPCPVAVGYTRPSPAAGTRPAVAAPTARDAAIPSSRLDAASDEADSARRSLHV